MKIKYFLFLLLFFFLPFGKGWGEASFAQNHTIDSLLILLMTDKSDTNKVNHLNKLSRKFLNVGEYESALKYGNEALQLATLIKAQRNEQFYNNPGKIDAETVPRDDVYFCLQKNIAFAHSNIGAAFYFKGNYPETLKNFFIALKINEYIGDKKRIAVSYNDIGNIYRIQGNYFNALKNHSIALKLRKDIKDTLGIANSYNNIGNIYWSQGNLSGALENYFNSLKIKKEINDKQGIADTYNNIGVVYTSQGNYQEALKNYFASLKIREDIGDKPGITTSFTNLSAVQIKLNNLKEAQDYLNKALQIANEIGYKEDIKDGYSNLAIIDSMQGNWKQAYEHHKQYIIYRDSIDNEETRKKITEATMTYEFEKKEAVIKADQEKKDAISAADKKRQQYVLLLISGVLLLVFILSGFIFRSLRLTQKQKIIIEEKSRLVEEKNKDFIDSINYAKKIQDALLHEAEHVSKYLPEYFILFKPKDIVSGDFYWSFKKDFMGTSYRYIAAVDCTGHGVPGAFMSMLGIAFLNEIAATNQLFTPAEILDKLRNKILRELGQGGQAGQSKDGMDISLVRFNLETKELQWAGANNPIYIVKNSTQKDKKNSELIEIKPNKQPIGYHPEMLPFTNHSIKLEKGSLFYLFTDGYADQFGGEKGKKFKYNKFKELLFSMHDKIMPEQKEILTTTFENWKTKVEQVDDVCIIGVRV